MNAMKALVLVLLLTVGAAARGFLMADLRGVNRALAVRTVAQQAGYDALILVPLEGTVDLKLRGDSLEAALGQLLPSEAGARYLEEHKAVLIAPRERLWKLQVMPLKARTDPADFFGCGVPIAKLVDYLEWKTGTPVRFCPLKRGWLVIGLPGEIEELRRQLAR